LLDALLKYGGRPLTRRLARNEDVVLRIDFELGRRACG
jgi:hypothetical protein